MMRRSQTQRESIPDEDGELFPQSDRDIVSADEYARSRSAEDAFGTEMAVTMLTRALGADPEDVEDRQRDIEFVPAGVRVHDLTGELVYDLDDEDEDETDDPDDYEEDEDEDEDDIEGETAESSRDDF